VNTLKKAFVLPVLAAACLLAITCTPSTEGTSAALARDLAEVPAEDVGLSTARLGRLSHAMQGLVDEGKLAGIVTLVSRHGKVPHFETFGHQDTASSTPMARDTIFRIYSMSKPITGVALMTLYEEGKFRLSDSLSKYIPEFADLMVASESGTDRPAVEKPNHPITIRELMTHTAGFTYGLFSRSPVDKLYRDAGVLDPDSALRDMILKLAKIPLLYQPGTRWHYSVAVDIQGYLVEVLSGRPFDVFLKERIFDPLGMKDTGFHVPGDKADRFAQLYIYDDDGALAVAEGENGYLKPTTFFSGGGGLVSTAMDYMRFCQMLLNGGELDGVRILAPLTVERMHQNHLPRDMGERVPGSGKGFGLDFSVVLDSIQADTSRRKGAYDWSGAAGTWFWIDPVEDLVFVGMIQQFGEGRPDMRSLTERLTYQAILKPDTTEVH
jgi:CubicO group peptidase (beta-lactamase class C family)